MSGPVAKRYARALFSLDDEDGQGEFENTAQELARLAALMHGDPGLRRAVDPTLDAPSRKAVAERLAEALHFSPRLGNFLALLAENNRLRFLDQIAREYRGLADRKLGRVRARIRTAKPLDDDAVRRIVEVFEAKLGKKVLAEVTIEPALLGGVIVESQGRVYDGSTRTQLERLQGVLAAG
ncbi:MAG: F-type H+-transporting ATPase subunit delta [Candidatus Binatota bacterium]|nr:F-type H+-transporting ATPase subunit delta [Candidatus Binatota bacterium]